MARFLVTLGLVLVLLGLLWPLIQKVGLGRLPGDIVIRLDHSHFYFPLTTSLLISALLSLIWWLFRR
jgi:ribose/xylose/arabinose/galactoside ABC-type transport system permease subunit